MEATMDAERLERALRIALAIPEERDLSLLRRRHLEEPGFTPENVVALSTPLRERLHALRESGEPAAERRRCELLEAELVSWDDPRYPAALFDLSAPPPVLWLRGRGAWPPVQPVTIVGA